MREMSKGRSEAEEMSLILLLCLHQWKRETGVLDVHCGLCSDDVARCGPGLRSPWQLAPYLSDRDVTAAMLTSVFKNGTK